MKFEGAIITQQGVKFAIVVVKRQVTQDSHESKETVARLQKIQEFRDLPLVLASQDPKGGSLEYRGRRDLVDFLATVDPEKIPWRKFETVETIKLPVLVPKNLVNPAAPQPSAPAAPATDAPPPKPGDAAQA